MLLCSAENLTDLLLQDYLTVCEEQNPGLTERTIAAVSGEIKDLLGYRYPGTWAKVPELVRYIASVLSAYRVVEAITSLVDTEGTTENEWIPLQKQWKHCNDLLEDIVAGRVKLPLEEQNPDVEEPSISVVTKKNTFDFRGF